MPWDPMKGERLAPAWKAATDLLKDGRWRTWGSVIEAMLKASDLQRNTCQNILYGAMKHGHVIRRGKFDQKTKKDTRLVAWAFKENR